MSSDILAVALYDFTKTKPDQLSFAKGDVLVCERLVFSHSSSFYRLH